MTTQESYATVLALLTALVAGLVGSFAQMKRMSLAGDVISHVALPGLGLALLFGINPLIGAAGISAFPMSARVVQMEGQKYNKKSYLLMHAMSANAGGQIGSVIAAAVMLSVLQGMGIIGS